MLNIVVHNLCLRFRYYWFSMQNCTALLGSGIIPRSWRRVLSPPLPLVMLPLPGTGQAILFVHEICNITADQGFRDYASKSKRVRLIFISIFFHISLRRLTSILHSRWMCLGECTPSPQVQSWLSAIPILCKYWFRRILPVRSCISPELYAFRKPRYSFLDFPVGGTKTSLLS